MSPQLSEAACKCPYLNVLLKAGKTPDEIILLMVQVRDGLLQDNTELKLMVPKRVRMSDGSLRIWRCPEEYIPVDEFAPVEIGDALWELKQKKIDSKTNMTDEPGEPDTPTDRLRWLTFDDFTREDFTKAIALLEELTPDVVVERSGPAPDHLHVSFVVPDTEQPSNIFPKYLEPAIQSLAKILPDTPKATVQMLPHGPVYAKGYNFPDSIWPVRCTVTYDSSDENFRVTLDILCGPSQ